MRKPNWRRILRGATTLAALVSLHCNSLSDQNRNPFALSRFPVLAKLSLPSSVSDIGWLEASRITHLDISNSQVMALKSLPQTVTNLRARSLSVESVNLSGAQVINLDILNTEVDGDSHIPPSLESIAVNGDIFKRDVYRDSCKNAQSITINDPYLDKLQIQRGVRQLELTTPSGFSWRSLLPSTLTSLRIKARSLDALPSLPPSVVDVSLINESKAGMPSDLNVDLPARVNSVRLEGVRVRNWADFADALVNLDMLANSYPESFIVRLNALTLRSLGGRTLSVKRWPAELERLTLKNFIDADMPPIPRSVKVLDLADSEIIDIKDLSAREEIEELSLENWSAVDLAQIPRSVKKLNLSGVKDILHMEKWPSGLQELVCERCRQQDLLRFLPSGSIAVIDIDESRGITEVPSYPLLQKLSLRGSDVQAINRESLGRLAELDICGSGVGDLSWLPSQLKSLAVTQEQLQSAPRLPELAVLVVRAKSDCSEHAYSFWANGK